MTTLELSPREAQALARLKARQKPTIAYLISGVYETELATGKMSALQARRSMTSLLHALNAKLVAGRAGKIVRLSARGRGHPGVYQLKRK